MSKKQYIIPTLTVVTFKVEQGFATSTFGLCQSAADQAMYSSYNSQNQEVWDEPSGSSGDLFSW